jgi:hypothetical protein
MRSVRLTKEMREDIAMKLTREAAACNVASLKKQIEKVATKFWDRHVIECEHRLGTTQDRWPALIRDGMLTATSSVVPDVLKNGKNPEYAFQFRINDKHPVSSTLLRDFKVHRVQYSATRRALVLEASKSHPRFNDYGVISGKLLAEYGECCDRLVGILEASVSMYDEAMSVLIACTTSRQLEDLLPQAAKLVPQPAAKGQAVMPSELATKVRGMIETGIPV